MTITVVFDPPLPSDSPATFNTKAFTTLGDLNDWSTEANALAAEINAGVPIATATHAATSKTTPVDADEIPLVDSAATFGLKKLTWANLKATTKTYFDTLYLGISATAANASQLLGGTWASPGAIGSTTPAAGSFATLAATDLTTTGNTVLGNATTDTVNIGAGGIIKDAGGNVGIGVAPAGSFNLAFPIGTNWYVGKHAATPHSAGNATRLDFGISDGSAVTGLSVRNTHDGTYSSQETYISASYGGLRATSDIFKVDKSGNAVVITPYGGLGYGTGAGGTVAQAATAATSLVNGTSYTICSLGTTNFTLVGAASNTVGTLFTATGPGTGTGTAAAAGGKSLTVTLNKPTGQITMNANALTSGASAAFIVNNSLVTPSDSVVVSASYTGVDPSNYRTELVWVGTGAFVIRLTNISGGSLSEAVVVNFAIIKGATS